MRRFFAQLATYWKALAGIVFGSLLPYLFEVVRDWLVERGLEYLVVSFPGPQVLDGIWNWLADEPVRAAAAAAILWVATAAGFSQQYVRRQSVPKEESKTLRTPKMTLNESFDSFIPTRDAMLGAMDNILNAMSTWNTRTDQIRNESKGKVDRAARDTFWASQAKALDQYAASLETGCTELSNANRKMRDVIEARLYWHDRRGVAADLLTAQSKEVFGQVRDASANLKAKLQRNQGLIDDHAMGWDAKMNKAAAKMKAANAKMITEYEASESLATAILEFREQRTGLRGLVRRNWRSAQRVFRRP